MFDLSGGLGRVLLLGVLLHIVPWVILVLLAGAVLYAAVRLGVRQGLRDAGAAPVRPPDRGTAT